MRFDFVFMQFESEHVIPYWTEHQYMWVLWALRQRVRGIDARIHIITYENALMPSFRDQGYLVGNYTELALQHTAFQAMYRPCSINGLNYEFQCFQRWNVLNTYMKAFVEAGNEVERIVALDLDVLFGLPWIEVWEKVERAYGAPLPDHATFLYGAIEVFTPRTLESYSNFQYWMYSDTDRIKAVQLQNNHAMQYDRMHPTIQERFRTQCPSFTEGDKQIHHFSDMYAIMWWTRMIRPRLLRNDTTMSIEGRYDTAPRIQEFSYRDVAERLECVSTHDVKGTRTHVELRNGIFSSLKNGQISPICWLHFVGGSKAHIPAYIDGMIHLRTTTLQQRRLEAEEVEEVGALRGVGAGAGAGAETLPSQLNLPTLLLLATLLIGLWMGVRAHVMARRSTHL